MTFMWLTIWNDSIRKVNSYDCNIVINDLCKFGGRWNQNMYILDDII